MVEKKGKSEYKIYEGIRCVLIIIPAKIRKLANVGAGDYISFRYDEERDEIIIKPRRVRST